MALLSFWRLAPSLRGSNNSFLRVLFMAQIVVVVEMAFFPSVMWTTTNELFSTKCCCPGETAGLFIKVPPSTKLYVVCPSEGIIFQRQDSNVPSDLLHDNFILVDEDGYSNCRYDRTKSPTTNKIVQNCTHNTNGPLQFRRLVFDKISIQDDLVFQPGQNYTFISTSDGTKDSLTNNQGPGRCNDTKNDLAMKMKIYVCNETEDCYTPSYINLCEDKYVSNSSCIPVDNREYCASRLKTREKTNATIGKVKPTEPTPTLPPSSPPSPKSGAHTSANNSLKPLTIVILILGWILAVVFLVLYVRERRKEKMDCRGVQRQESAESTTTASEKLSSCSDDSIDGKKKQQCSNNCVPFVVTTPRRKGNRIHPSAKKS